MRFFVAFFFCSVLVGSSICAHAESRIIKDGDLAVATIDVFDGWSADNLERGVMISSPDGKTIAWLDAVLKGNEKAVVRARTQLLEKEGFVVAGDKRHAETSQGHLFIRITDYASATYRGEPTVLRTVWVNPALQSQRLMFVTFWSSPLVQEQQEILLKMIVGLTFLEN